MTRLRASPRRIAPSLEPTTPRSTDRAAGQSRSAFQPSMIPTHTPDCLELRALLGFPYVRQGDDLPEMIWRSIRDNEMALAEHDILVVAQKVVSKAEGRQRLLDDVAPSAAALRYAQETGKDPRLVELILEESVSVVRQSANLLITENRLGLVMANAGIDQSNVQEGCALLLPEDPDESARAIQAHLARQSGVRTGVVIADSIGRAWRNGIIGHAIGLAGIKALVDARGARDLHDRELRVTEIAIADEVAAAASLLMGQAAEGKPVVLVRGFCGIGGDSSAKELLRRSELDLFR